MKRLLVLFFFISSISYAASPLEGLDPESNIPVKVKTLQTFVSMIDQQQAIIKELQMKQWQIQKEYDVLKGKCSI